MSRPGQAVDVKPPVNLDVKSRMFSHISPPMQTAPGPSQMQGLPAPPPLQPRPVSSIGQPQEPAAKIRRLNDGSQAVLFNLSGGIGSLGGLGSDSSDLLQNLLGVEGNALDSMLDSNPDNAAKMLGVK